MSRTVTLSAVALGLSLASQASAQPLVQARAHAGIAAVIPGVDLVAGRIEGVVTDHNGLPIPGVAVSAIGPDTLFGVTDRSGRFVFAAVPVGTYLVRAQRAGYRASTREFIDVAPASSARHIVRLARLEGTALPPTEAGADADVTQPVIAAGFGGTTTIAPAPGGKSGADDHEHNPRLWRLRHMKRSVLRETQGQLALDAVQDDIDWLEERFGVTAAREASARGTSSFFGDASLSGQIQFLTATAFDDGGSGEETEWAQGPAGVAFATVGAPIGNTGAWSVRGAIGRGDMSSWIVAGNYIRPTESRHALDLGASFALQSFSDDTPAALVSVPERRRAAGSIHAFDTWRLHRRAVVTYGTRYAYHDYLDRPTLMSPSVSTSVSPLEKTWVRVAVTQQMLAPGAEEFDARNLSAFSMPPQRTFTSASRDGRLSAQRTRHVEVGLDRQIGQFLLNVRRFEQTVDNQLVAMFGVGAVGAAPDLGHYAVANGGNLTAGGWVFGVSHDAGPRFRGGVEYTVARAQWFGTGDRGVIAVMAPSADRVGRERIHDVTARVVTDVPETATRVTAIYKVNSAFARRSPLLADAATDARFDVQVSQRLPFLAATGADWEFVVAVRNMFRDGDGIGSLYDELLVVRPPKRIVGGVLVKF
ncbi:MAG TPA: carboxypeptidase-like regulatory domain-containing protein [Luteitalea sp.]|nr:carboxypeptidase-like regulatory domain-containing protein [Luteitalea sp.]